MDPRLAGATVTAAVLAAWYVFYGPNIKKAPRRRTHNTVPGLYNLGKLCFLNAILQALAPCSSILEWMQKVNKTECLKLGLKDRAKLLDVLSTVLQVLNYKIRHDDDCYDPTAVVNVLMNYRWIIPNEEQDAHEILHVLTSTLEEELTSVPWRFRSLDDVVNGNVGAQDEIRKICQNSPFKGLLACQLTCKTCGYKNAVTFDAFDSLSLIIPKHMLGQVSLQTCIRHFLMSETVQDVECDNCGKQPQRSGGSKYYSAFTRRMAIGKFPNCLCIHIQRTVWLDYGVPMKRFEFVQYPELLCMDDFFYGGTFRNEYESRLPNKLVGGSELFAMKSESVMCSLAPMSIDLLGAVSGVMDKPASKSGNFLYNLQAVIVHHGDLTGGHFVTYRRGAVGTRMHNSWFWTSDTIVKETSISEILRSNAYMLFYERT